MALIIFALLLLIIFGPQLWARRILKVNAKERDDIEGTGAEFARHLLDNAHLAGYGVEKAHPTTGDHFDPTSRTVRLSEPHHDHRSLSAIVVAAHEVGQRGLRRIQRSRPQNGDLLDDNAQFRILILGLCEPPTEGPAKVSAVVDKLDHRHLTSRVFLAPKSRL